jgi:CubicO group peptidase (beta-lactamase class C family)
VGSITKQFTGAAILKLAEEGGVAIDAPMSAYLDAVPSDKQAITLHHLLTHSSGIVDLPGAGDWDPIGRDEFVARILSEPLAFPPGEGYTYSNAGYSLLGAILERVTGAGYEAWLREQLLLPAGLFETGYLLPSWGEARLAQGYGPDGRWGTVLERPMAPDGPWWVLRANGGIHSTAWDMVRWSRALQEGRVLSPSSLEACWAPHVDEGEGESFYGYGWVVTEIGGERVVTHNGGNGIFFADMAIVPGRELTAILMTNVAAEQPWAGNLLEWIGARLLGGVEMPRIPAPVDLPDEDLARFEGPYEPSGGGRWTIRQADGRLLVEADDPVGFSRLHSTRPVDLERAGRLSSRLDEVVAAELRGDLGPLWRAYEERVILEVLATVRGERLRALEERLGRSTGHRVMGTAFRDGRDVTLVRYLFERGHDDSAYVWDPKGEGRLLGVSARGLDPAVHLLPEAAGSWATWDPREGASEVARFSSGPEGEVRLILERAGGAVEARRSGLVDR